MHHLQLHRAIESYRNVGSGEGAARWCTWWLPDSPRESRRRRRGEEEEKEEKEEEEERREKGRNEEKRWENKESLECGPLAARCHPLLRRALPIGNA
jgi:hypothetical protein